MTLDPIVHPSPQIQVRWELKSAWEEERPEVPEAWRRQSESIAEFQVWKSTHPGDGTMTKLFRWTPYIIVTVSFITMSPLILVTGWFAHEELKRRAAHRRV